MRLFSAGFFVLIAMLQVAPPNGTIDVSVIKAGTALPQALRSARLELTGGPGTPIVGRTGVNGRFVFSNLAPGQYQLAVTCDGFIRKEYPKRIVIGRGQPAANILFELESAPTAAGRVLDSYGEPVSDITVEALRRSYDVRGKPQMSRAASAVTDDRGEYRIFWLDPGDYFFAAVSNLPDSADEKPGRIFEPTYFNNVSSPEDAKSARLDIGREVRIDFRLSKRVALWVVNGHTMDAVNGRTIGATLTLTPPTEDPSFARYQAQTSVTSLYPGEFSVRNILPGAYILMAKSGSSDREIVAFQRIVLRPIPQAPPPVRDPEYNGTIKLSPALSINGRFFIESRETADLHQATVSLLSVDSSLPSPRMVSSRRDGQFTLNGTIPGAYVLDVSNLPEDLYLKAARFNDADILEKPLALEAQDAAKPLQLLLGSDGGSLQAAVYDRRGELHSGAQVVLVPDIARRYRREQYRLGMSGEDGTALVRGIPPGNYKVFAWENLEPNAYLNADYLLAYEDFGVPLKVIPGANAPIAVRLIPKD